MILRQVAVSSSLFGGIPLPQWGDESPERLYALFNGYQTDTLSKLELDEYSRLLMVVVANAFHSNDFLRKLPQIRLDPQDVAQEAVGHLMRKTRTMRLNHPCWRVLLWVMNVSVRRIVTTIAKNKRSRDGREMPATDYYVDHGRPEEAAGTADAIAAVETPGERELFAALGGAEDQILGDIPVKKPLTVDAVERLFRHLVRSMITGASLPTHANLPTTLKQEVSLELHALVASRVVRFVGELAQH
jgi:hypothetical protein